MKVDHNNVVRYIEIVVDNQGVPHIVMEFIDGLTLDEYCERFRPNVYRKGLIMRLAVRGARAIHDAGLIHRDIRPDHIMITAKHDVVLCGLGLTFDSHKNRNFISAIPSTKFVSMMNGFAAPELFNNKGSYNRKVDSFSVGAVGFYLFEEKMPDPQVANNKFKTPRNNFHRDF